MIYFFSAFYSANKPARTLAERYLNAQVLNAERLGLGETRIYADFHTRSAGHVYWVHPPDTRLKSPFMARYWYLPPMARTCDVLQLDLDAWPIRPYTRPETHGKVGIACFSPELGYTKPPIYWTPKAADGPSWLPSLGAVWFPRGKRSRSFLLDLIDDMREAEKHGCGNEQKMLSHLLLTPKYYDRWALLPPERNLGVTRHRERLAACGEKPYVAHGHPDIPRHRRIFKASGIIPKDLWAIWRKVGLAT